MKRRIKRTFWEELITYFLIIRHGLHRKRRQNWKRHEDAHKQQGDLISLIILKNEGGCTDGEQGDLLSLLLFLQEYAKKRESETRQREVERKQYGTTRERQDEKESNICLPRRAQHTAVPQHGIGTVKNTHRHTDNWQVSALWQYQWILK
jgi:hypothetical protein